MRIGKVQEKIIKEVESDGYVWLSHLSRNAIERFRYKTRNGFKHYLKIGGLTFLTKRLASEIERGSKTSKRRRLTYKEQIVKLENDLAEMEIELYRERNVAPEQIIRRYENE